MRWDREPWVKLFVRELGTFARLPLMVRGLAAELLKFVDEDGRLPLCGDEPWLAIARVCGATPSDRRLLRGFVPMLLEDGYLKVDDNSIVVANFSTAQRRKERQQHHTTSRERVSNEPVTSQQRTSNESATNRSRAGNDSETKVEVSCGNHSATTSGSSWTRRIDPIREEKSIGEDPPLVPPGGKPTQLALVPDTTAAPPRRPRRQLSDFPESWKPKADLYAIGVEKGLDRRAVDAELATFRDHHTANGNRFADWDAAARTWIRRVGRYSGGAQRAQGPPVQRSNGYDHSRKSPLWEGGIADEPE